MGGPYNVGEPCHILQSGKNLTIVNENGDKFSGVLLSKTKFEIDLAAGGSLSATLNKNVTRINWANGTWWIRAK